MTRFCLPNYLIGPMYQCLICSTRRRSGTLKRAMLIVEGTGASHAGIFTRSDLGRPISVTTSNDLPGRTIGLVRVLQKCNTLKVGWTVEVLDTRVRDELEALPADVRARFRRIVELIQHHGLKLMREPHVKHLEGPLWEMRMKGKDGISRAIYVTASGRRVVVVRAFIKKTRKTPQKEIKLALERAKEVNP